VPEFVSRHQLTGTRDERFEDLERLIGKADFQAVPAEFTGLCVELKNAEAKNVRIRAPDVHCSLG